MEAEARQDGAAFPVTQWSLIDRAGADSSPEQREALGILLNRYLPALRAHLVLQRRIAPERAEDLIQSFVARKVLEQRIIDRSDRERGKFRTFLLRALNHYVIDQHREENAARRRPADGQLMAIDDQFDQAGDEPEPSAAFDREWARQVLAEAVSRMRAECDESKRPDIWGVFDGRVLQPCMHDAPAVAYENLQEQFRFASPAQASNVLMTAKRMFARHLRAVVGEYATAEEGQIEEELADLQRILQANA
jgi:RNA polymerase sigma-70 factor (ECF subfamily)